MAEADRTWTDEMSAKVDADFPRRQITKETSQREWSEGFVAACRLVDEAVEGQEPGTGNRSVHESSVVLVACRARVTSTWYFLPEKMLNVLILRLSTIHLLSENAADDLMGGKHEQLLW